MAAPEKGVRITPQAIRYTLRHLNNPMALRKSPLCQLPQVEARLATYNNVPWARALALRDTILAIFDQVDQMPLTDPCGLQIKEFLKLYLTDANKSTAAREMGIQRHRLYTRIMPNLIDLVTDTLEHLN